MYKALMIEDHKEVRDFVKEYFNHKEIEVIEAQNGYEGLSLLDDTIDIILLDIMMPGIDGYEVCKQIRSQYNTLIVFISALSEDENQLKAYEYGADDYITKPFEIEELLARLRLIFRKWSNSSSKVYELDYLKVDLSAHTTEVAGKTVNLTQREFSLLSYFLEHRGIVVSRADILDDVWGMDFDGQENTVDAYVRYLRAKIDLPNHKSLIETVRGIGYRLNNEN